MPNHNSLSESEQMYLVTIRKICETCTDTPIPIPQLAEELSVLPVSVNQMVKKLAEAGYVEYIPYKGVELTAEGRAISTRVLRHRRLWEVFLVKDLQMTLDQANDLTCRLEHITTEEVAQRLSSFLGDPTVCFHGSPIYQDGWYSYQPRNPTEQPQSRGGWKYHSGGSRFQCTLFLSRSGYPFWYQSKLKRNQ